MAIEEKSQAPSTDIIDIASIPKPGDYQFITIKELVNDFMLTQGRDSYVSTEDRFMVLHWFRRGLQDFNFDILKRIKSIELDMFAAGKIVLPVDFVGLVRLSFVDENGQAHIMIEDERNSIAKSYLQDHEYEILLDNNGEGLEAESESSRNFEKVKVCVGCRPSDLLSSGDYVLDKEQGVIVFTKVPKSETFLMEYFSDGLEVENQRVHKLAEQALYDFVYWKLIERNRNVPANEKYRARAEFYNTKRLAHARLNPLRWNDIQKLLSR